MSFYEMYDKEVLQRLQDEFCKVTGLYAYCLDEQKNKITRMSGREEKAEDVYRYIGCAQINELIDRIEDDSLEDYVLEELSDHIGGVAALSVKLEGKTVIYWVVIKLFEMQSAPLEDATDLLRDASLSFLVNKADYYFAEEKSRREKTENQKLSKNLEDNEAMTQIVQLLDSDDPIEQIMERWLKTICEHLGNDTAQVFSICSKEGYMDVVCEWRRAGMISFFDKSSHVESYSFLCMDKPVALTLDTAQPAQAVELEMVGLCAVMVFPFLKQENNPNRMVLAINYRNPHAIVMDEIQFVSDAVKLMQSILTRRIQKNSLAGSYAALEAVLDNVGSAIYVADKETGKILFINRRCKNTFTVQLKQGHLAEFLKISSDKLEERFSDEVFYEETQCWYDINYREITWVDGRRAILYSLYDITDKKVYQRRIEQQAYTDFLTGLYNRMCCERDLGKAIDAAKNAGEPGALLYLDLDDFKHINDGLGHQYGDVLLKAISHAMQRIEGIQNTCYRMGGDEFVIVVGHKVYPEFARIMEQIKEIFSKPWFLKNADYYCTMSMGIVMYPECGDSVPELIKKADIAMYEAKKTGKNRVAYYSDSLDTVSGRRLDMEKDMRDATVRGFGEFEVYFQPIINVTGKKPVCAGAEALLRWNSSKLGFISPLEFIPLAEYLGLINPIGNFVLREACCRCKYWNDHGYPDYKINVNLSVVQLLQPDIVEVVDRTLKETGLNSANLTLEVTESLAINDMERMKDILNRIKQLGVSLALDDFGTGYSSLNHVREIPIDVIKVDQSFVKELADDAYSQSFIKMVSELGETIGVSICVEGIETPSQYKVLQDMKIKYIQGYYFDRPMSCGNFENRYCPDLKQTKKGEGSEKK